ncbi:MAG TPA: glycerate kinase [Dehalococcoidia bacterium]|nr:glycerate kinase [Dehalococcoidia bacterium]
MQILVCPQEFKGSLTAREAADAIARGLRRALPRADIDVAPMADGGPGTVEAVLSSASGHREKATVQDPLGRPVEAYWALLDDGPTALIEMAAASGLVLLKPEERDPRRAGTYGTGRLIRAALDAGSRRLIVGVGGSATNDGGAGMAQALGARLLDAEGQDLPPGGAALVRLDRIDVSGIDPRLIDCEVTAATDALNPLCGPSGASAVYGPQKGATPEAVTELDAALRHYADVVRRDLGIDIASIPGAGAAGGMGGGLVAFLKARIESGAELVAAAMALQQRIAAADVVFTGEGRLDAQTAYGKSVSIVAHLAKELDRPVIALAGSIVADGSAMRSSGIDAALPIATGPATESEMCSRAAPLLSDAAERAIRLLLVGKSLAL